MTKPTTGQILISSGGYDCTIVNFYEVVKTTPTTVTLVKVAKAPVEQSEGPTRFVVPTPTKVGEPFRRKIKDYGTFWSVAVTDYEFAQSVYSGTPIGETAPGWY
jgi:hypothetical protein